jgi:MFS transporter, OFA family, oxalate/formate antiporter
MKIKLFYGWYIVIAGSAVCLFYSAIFTYGWTSFITPILTTFGWSVTELSLVSTLRGFEVGVFNPFLGSAVDRFSLKKLMFSGVIVMGLGIFIISQAQNLPIYYAGFLVMGVATSAVTSMIPSTAIARWFRKDIGKANSIFYLGMGLGGMLVPAVTFGIDHYGWRETLLFGAAAMTIIGLPLSFVYRQRPEDHGLVPDGKVAVKSATTSKPPHDNIKIRQVLKMPVFWYLSVFGLFQAALAVIVTVFIMPSMENVGVSRETAGLVVLMIAITSTAVRVPLGIMADKFRKSLVIALTTGFLGASYVILYLINAQSSLWIMGVFAILCGAGLSGVMTLRMPILTDYFGVRNIGSIFGFISISSTIGTISSLPIAGWVFDNTHSFKPVFIVLIALSIVSIVLLFIMPSPQQSQASLIGQTAIPD